MPQQYTATDKRTGLEIAVTGEFPSHPDDRVRIAATINLFTRLMATVLSTENDSDRRALFKSLELALDLADAFIRQDNEAINLVSQRLLSELGISREQLEEMIRRLQEGTDGPNGPLGPGGPGPDSPPPNLN